MSKIYTVYVHISPSNKAYVGVTGCSTTKRWGPTGLGYKSQVKFYRAIQKYGWDAFEHKILYTTTSLEEAYEKEKEFIQKYNSFEDGYNADFGGSGAEGHRVSAEAREIMSKLKIGKPGVMTGKSRKELMIKVFIYDLNKTLVNTFLGYEDASKALNVNISNLRNAANYGFALDNKYFITNEKTDALLDSYFDRYHQIHSSANVILYDFDGNVINSFKSYREASEATGISVGTIGKCCVGLVLRTSKGIFLKPTEAITCRLDEISKKWPKGPMMTKKDKIIKVQQFLNDTGLLVAEYDNYKQAAEATNIDRKRIIANCNGHAYTTGDFYFKKIVEE